jgi:PAS domain S-box-containing protein
LRDLLAQAPAAIGYLSGPEFRWGYVNDLYVRAAGRASADDLLGLTLKESMPELEGTGVFEVLEDIYRTGRSYHGREHKVRVRRRETGRLEDRYFDFVYQPVLDRSHEVQGIFVHAVDITEQVLSRIEAETSEERLRLAQEAAQIGTWEWDPVRDTRTLSPELHRMFGTTAAIAGEQIYHVWASRVLPEDWPRLQQEMIDTQRTGILECEYRYQNPVTGLRCFYCKGGRVKGGTSFFGIVIDITDRKLAEEAQKEKERELKERQERLQAALSASQRLAAIVESSDDAIIGKDLNGIVTSWNPSAERIFGYTAEEMIGQSVKKIIPPEMVELEDRIMSSVARGAGTQHFETFRRGKNGDLIEVSQTVSPVTDDSGKIAGLACISRDVTQSKRVERALHTSERLAAVGRLAATIAHEINNPLEAVTNLIFLAQNSSTDEDAQRFLDQAQHELTRVALLTKQTLGFYRENKGASPLTLGELISPLVSVFSARARNKAIRIDTEVRQNPTIHAIAGEIRQLFANLLNNSIDAVRDGDRILIRVSSAREPAGAQRAGVRLTVADTGPGIPRDLRKKLFEPFFTTKRDVGTGLGLWVSKTILEKHHGTIHLRSSNVPGRSWTAFSVFLPLNAEPGRIG